MLSLNTGVRFRLSPTVAVVRRKGVVWLVTEKEIGSIEGDDVRIGQLLELLNSGCTGAEVKDVLGKQEGERLLDVLWSQHSLMPARTMPEKGAIWESQFGYLALHTDDPSIAQARLRNSKVALIGVGGIGSVVLEHLVGSGVGSFILIDHDRIATSNLNRQFVFPVDQVGRQKVDAAREYVLARNPRANVLSLVEAVESADQLGDIFADKSVDLVVLAADHPPGAIQAIVGDYCVAHRISLCMAATGLERGYWGPLLIPNKTGCYSCFARHKETLLTNLERVVEQNTARPSSYSFGPLNTLIGSLLARDILLYLMGAIDIASSGTRMVLDFSTLRTSLLSIESCNCWPDSTIKRSPEVEVCRNRNLSKAIMKPMDELVVEMDVVPLALEPGCVFDQIGAMLAHAIREPLFEATDSWNLFLPAAAEEGTPHDGGATWTLRLRQDLQWSDGTPVVADDVKRAISHLLHPRSVAPLRWLAEIIDRVEIPDERNLTFKLTRPIAYLPALLANDCFAPRHRCWDEGGVDGTDALIEIPTSGPFRLAGEIPGGRGFIVETNPYGRRYRPTAPRRIVFLRTDSPEQGLRLFDRGLVHVTANTTFPPHFVSAYRSRPEYLQSDLTMAAQLQPTSDRFTGVSSYLARRAMALAIDGHALTKCMAGAVAPMWHYVDMWMPEPVWFPPARPDEARRAWQNSSIDRSESIKIGYADFSPNREVLEVISEHWKDVLGLRTILVALSYAEYVRQLATSHLDFLYTLVPAAYQDPSSMLVPFRSGQFLAKKTNFADTRFDQLLMEAESEEDLVLRVRGYRQANERLLEGMPVIPVMRCQSIVLQKLHVQGLIVNRGGLFSFEQIFDSWSNSP